MRHRSSLWRLAVAQVALLVFGVFASAVSAQTATVRLADDSELNNQTLSITGKMPVLFVHGHGAPSNYQVNWQQPLTERRRRLTPMSAGIRLNDSEPRTSNDSE